MKTFYEVLQVEHGLFLQVFVVIKGTEIRLDQVFCVKEHLNLAVSTVNLNLQEMGLPKATQRRIPEVL